MAKQKLIKRLQQGTDKWNSWRAEHQDVDIDLRAANLSGANLNGVNLRAVNLNGANLRAANLSEANLSEANLWGADLIGTNLRAADLIGANLRAADLSRADLRAADLIGANLIFADLYEANLSRADLSEADLRAANLNSADLSGADLSGAMTRDTHFDNIDLRGIKGLETIRHQGPSHISTSTLERSEGDIPDVFLRGAGLSETFIEYVHALVSHPIQYYTCFICYSSRDQDFAERLHADLQNQGIRCWCAPRSMKPGTVDEAISDYDKLLLVLSSVNSVESTWAEFEVEAALDKEKERHQKVLFPIRLDDTVLRTTQAWAAGIRRQRHIGDFSAWKDHDTYQHIFDRLVRDLRTSTANQKT